MFTAQLYLNYVCAFRCTSMNDITLHTIVYVYSVSVYSCLSMAECIQYSTVWKEAEEKKVWRGWNKELPMKGIINILSYHILLLSELKTNLSYWRRAWILDVSLWLHCTWLHIQCNKKCLFDVEKAHHKYFFLYMLSTGVSGNDVCVELQSFSTNCFTVQSVRILISVSF